MKHPLNIFFLPFYLPKIIFPYTYSHNTSDNPRKSHYPSIPDYPDTSGRSFRCLLQTANSVPNPTHATACCCRWHNADHVRHDRSHR